MTNWIFDRRTDISMFGLPCLLVLILGVCGQRLGLEDAPTWWFWLSITIMLDSAHVYGMLFRVYFDKTELSRRPWLYATTPIVAVFICLSAIYINELYFWRLLSYVAVYHFIKQQIGWLRIYQKRGQYLSRIDRSIDMTALLSSMIYPLAYWHTHERQFIWFSKDGFFLLPEWVSCSLRFIAMASLLLYAANALLRYLKKQGTPGKDLLITATALCWYVGIVSFNADYMFTASNVTLHSVPYLVLIYRYGVGQHRANAAPLWRMFKIGPYFMLFCLWLFALAEDFLWDRHVLHENEWIFGSGTQLSEFATLAMIAVLTVPQLVHFILDGFIWRTKNNPTLRVLFSGF